MPSVADAAKPQCPDRPGRTIQVDGTLRMYQTVGLGKDGGLASISGGVLRAVDRGGVRVLAPAAAPGTASVSDLAVAGNRVYWTTTATGVAATTMLDGHATTTVAG